MNKSDFIRYLHQPADIRNISKSDISYLLETFPYFQTAHLVYSAYLKSNDDIQFHDQLKLAAAHVSDRSVLYWLIYNQGKFIGPEPETADKNVTITGVNDVEGHEPEAAEDQVPQEHDSGSPTQQVISSVPENAEAGILADTTSELQDDYVEQKEAATESGCDETPAKEPLAETPAHPLPAKPLTDAALENAVPEQTADAAKAKEHQASDENIPESTTETPSVDQTAVLTPESQDIKHEEPVLPSEGQDVVGETGQPFVEPLIKEEIIPENVLPGEADMSDEPLKKSTPVSHNQPQTFLLNIISKRVISGAIKEEQAATQLEPESEKIKPEKVPDLIDKFIREEPRISKPRRDFFNPTDMAENSSVDKEDIVSETLAKIYISQGLYHKALKIYQKLYLLIPEKNAYFAAQIENLENKINN